MKNFIYTITDPLGIHARPAGLLAKLAKDYADTVIAFWDSTSRGTKFVIDNCRKKGKPVTVYTLKV